MRSARSSRQCCATRPSVWVTRSCSYEFRLLHVNERTRSRVTPTLPLAARATTLRRGSGASVTGAVFGRDRSTYDTGAHANSAMRFQAIPSPGRTRNGLLLPQRSWRPMSSAHISSREECQRML